MNITRINAEKIGRKSLEQAARLARAGVPVAFPTDTVYGLGVAVRHDTSPRPLFALKGSDPGKAIPWLVADIRALEVYGSDVSACALALARAHWPGALTLIVRASSAVPAPFLPPDGTIALRAPAHPVARALIEAVGGPLATTSANLASGEPATSLATLDARLAAQLALIIDAGPTPGAVPSTIVSCTDEAPRLIREGALPAALLLH
jgi:tRNA threonylcarbamoyl adenosine modification protein (Sua5/YciO/YrdC/YwlC family)